MWIWYIGVLFTDQQARQVGNKMVYTISTYMLMYCIIKWEYYLKQTLQNVDEMYSSAVQEPRLITLPGQNY